MARPVPPAPPVGAAAWLVDHLPAPAPVALAADYTADRALLGIGAGGLLGLLCATAGGLLAIGLGAALGGTVLALVVALLAARFVASPLVPRKIAVGLRVARARLALARAALLLRATEDWLAWLDRRESRRLDAVGAARLVATGAAREELAALDRALGRFAVERQLLDRAEEEDVAARLRDLRQQLAADHLAAYPVLTAAIPGLGPQLKLRLLTAGVRTAAQIGGVQPATGAGNGGWQIEVPGRSPVRIDGLGRQKAEALLAWRRLLERQSVVALPEALPAADDAAIRLRYHQRRAALDRREASATRVAERRKDACRARLRARRAALDRQATTIRRGAAGPRERAEVRLAARQGALARAHLALALARRDLAAYDEVRFGRYLRRVLLGAP